MEKIIVWLILNFKLDIISTKISCYFEIVKVKRLSQKYNTTINYFQQGTGGLTISSNNEKSAGFKIDKTSHLKSETYIECTGGVIIGRYFHTGRGLTIFSTNHNYESKRSIPYDEITVCKAVIIEDFVWFGSNVTIVPGVTVGEGAVVGSGAVLTKDVPPFSIVGGNPAKIIKRRDIELFENLKHEGKFY